MRDAHRIKERYELSLDNRQIVSVVISALVVLGAVFVLGVVVGKKLSADQVTAAAPDILSALDARAAALQEVKKESPHFTFQEELTRKGVDPLPDAAIPTPAPLAISAAVDAGPTREVVQVAVEPELAEAPRSEATLAARKEDAGGALQRAIARAQLPMEAAEGGMFTLQLSASQDRSEAERYVAKLRDRGYAPFMVTAEVPGRGTWYRVRMGSFATKEAANRYLEDFKRETQMDAFVAPNN